MQQCKDGTYPEPHIWAMAERIYRALSDKGTLAQSVVVSGESGAGKRSSTPPEPRPCSPTPPEPAKPGLPSKPPSALAFFQARRRPTST